MNQLYPAVNAGIVRKGSNPGLFSSRLISANWRAFS
jgi:hypothetical protein